MDNEYFAIAGLEVVTETKGLHTYYIVRIPDDMYLLHGQIVTAEVGSGMVEGRVIFTTVALISPEAKECFLDGWIIGEKVSVPVKDIVVPEVFSGTKPQISKLAQRIKEYYFGDSFKTPVVFEKTDEGYVIADGYTAYLVCKMFNVEELSGYIE